MGEAKTGRVRLKAIVGDNGQPYGLDWEFTHSFTISAAYKAEIKEHVIASMVQAIADAQAGSEEGLIGTSLTCYDVFTEEINNDSTI